MSQAQISNDKTPRTERGRRTLRKLLDAAATEFADKGFHEASISGITRRAGVALGTFYTYYDSKDAIFRALVSSSTTRAEPLSHLYFFIKIWMSTFDSAHPGHSRKLRIDNSIFFRKKYLFVVLFQR